MSFLEFFSIGFNKKSKPDVISKFIFNINTVKPRYRVARLLKTCRKQNIVSKKHVEISETIKTKKYRNLDTSIYKLSKNIAFIRIKF